METYPEWGEVGADYTEKQGHSAFPSLLPFRHLASTKGCYVTAIYTCTPFPSHIRQHHMQTKCSSAVLQLHLLLSQIRHLSFSPGRKCLLLCCVFQMHLQCKSFGGKPCYAVMPTRCLTREMLSQHNVQLLELSYRRM